MKRFIKIVTASVIASACLVTSASAYLDMGDSLSYSVKSDDRDWDNQDNTWAWNLQNDSTCVFKGTVTYGCSADYALYQWKLGLGKEEAISVGRRNAGFSQSSKKNLPTDDYFAEVTYVSGGINNGVLTFSKKS